MKNRFKCKADVGEAGEAVIDFPLDAVIFF